ncbi:MAG TPA: class I SAM-dependent methyltransferase [Polyangiaceae bacterium]|nr:class I SAM-dependent methyltransferase [Polyangiaceae bacterium]
MAPVLQFLTWQLRLREAATETSRIERDELARFARGRSRLVEIGVAQGVTTKRLRSGMAPDGELWAVDPYFPNRLGLRFSELIAKGEVSSVENGSVRWVRTTGVEAAALWKREGRPAPDFVFIDGDHSWQGIEGDWSAWSALVAPGGIIGLHDSRPMPKFPVDADSVRFTRDIVHHDPRFRVVAEIESLTVVERSA